MRDMRKILGTLIGIMGFIAAIAGLTYAMYMGDITNNNTITGGHNCEELVSYTKGSEVNVSELKSVNEYTETTATTTITFYSTCGYSEGIISINTAPTTSAALLNNLLKYTIVSNQQVVSTGYITQTGDTNINIGLLNTTSTTYNVYLWIEKNSGTIISTNLTYSGYIHASAKQTSTYTK